MASTDKKTNLSVPRSVALKYLESGAVTTVPEYVSVLAQVRPIEDFSALLYGAIKNNLTDVAKYLIDKQFATVSPTTFEDLLTGMNTSMRGLFYEYLMSLDQETAAKFITQNVLKHFDGYPLDLRIKMYQHAGCLPKRVPSIVDIMSIAKIGMFFPGLEVVTQECLDCHYHLDLSLSEFGELTEQVKAKDAKLAEVCKIIAELATGIIEKTETSDRLFHDHIRWTGEPDYPPQEVDDLDMSIRNDEKVLVDAIQQCDTLSAEIKDTPTLPSNDYDPQPAEDLDLDTIKQKLLAFDTELGIVYGQAEKYRKNLKATRAENRELLAKVSALEDTATEKDLELATLRRSIAKLQGDLSANETILAMHW